MARGIEGEESYQPQVPAEELPRKLEPRMEAVPVGQGFEQAFSAMDQKFRADSATWAGNQLAAFRTKAITDLETAKQQAPAGDPGDFTPKYLQLYDKNAQGLLDDPSVRQNPVASKMVQQGLFTLRDTLAQHSVEWEATQRKASQLDSIQQNLDTQLPLVRSHPDIATQVGSTLNDQIQATIADPSQKLQLLRAMDTKLTRSAALGLVDQNPGGVYQQLQADQPDDPILQRLTDPATRQEVQEAAAHGLVEQLAGGALDKYRTQGPAAGAAAYAAVDNLTLDKDPVRNDQMKDLVRAAIQRQRGELIAENQQKFGPQVMALEESLKAGQPDPTRRGQIWAGYRNNWLTPEQTGAMLGEDDRLNLKGAGDGVGIQAIDDAYNGKGMLNPKDKDVKDDAAQWFNQKTEQAQLPQGSQAWVNLGAELAHRTGVVPAPVMDWSRAALVSSQDPNVVYQAALAVDRMRGASPRGFEYADDDHKLGAIADSVLRLTKAGMPAAEAVQTARENYARGEGDAALMSQQWAAAKPFGKEDTALDQVLSKQVADDPALTTSGWLWGRNPLPHPTAMQSDYETLVRANFNHNGGNVAQAEADAARDIGTKWGITQMNGAPELVKYPPERMFRAPDGGPGLTAADIRADLEQHLKAPEAKDAFVHWDAEQRKMVPFQPDPAHVKLVSIPTVTENSGGTRWGVVYENETGAPETVFNHQGQPLTYTLPVKSTDYAAMKTQQLAEAKTKALERLKNQNEIEQLAQQQLADDQATGAQHPGEP